VASINDIHYSERNCQDAKVKEQPCHTYMESLTSYGSMRSITNGTLMELIMDLFNGTKVLLKFP
jgi:hypothetical protein